MLFSRIEVFAGIYTRNPLTTATIIFSRKTWNNYPLNVLNFLCISYKILALVNIKWLVMQHSPLKRYFLTITAFFTPFFHLKKIFCKNNLNPGFLKHEHLLRAMRQFSTDEAQFSRCFCIWNVWLPGLGIPIGQIEDKTKSWETT